MNAFANMLFVRLLGWTRAFVRSIWQALDNTDTYQSAKWLGDNWLWLAAFLVLLGMGIDFFVWFLRWRPYYLWRGARKARRALDEEFDSGYQDAVVFENEADEPTPASAYQDEAYNPLYEYDYAKPVSVEEAESAQHSERRRRSDKYRHARRYHALSSVRTHLTDTEDEQMLQELPPAVDKDAAFYQPVYPQYYPPQNGGNNQNGNYT